jgi:hypothetical protein
MIIKEYQYCGYTIELHEHPIYHDFEYVVKNDKGQVEFASLHPYEHYVDAKATAELEINYRIEYLNLNYIRLNIYLRLPRYYDERKLKYVILTILEKKNGIRFVQKRKRMQKFGINVTNKKRIH